MNPIGPAYRWEARYEIGRLLQCDVDGWHTSREIDRTRLRSLVLHGHPASPLVLPMPRREPPDEVLVRATTDLQATLELGTNGREMAAARWVFLGVRYGEHAWYVQLDPAGHLLALEGRPLRAGAALDPVPCHRCPGG